MPDRFIESRIFLLASSLRAKPLFGYGFALVSFLAALVARFGVADFLPAGFPFLTFFPAVILTGVFGGTVPGIICGLLSTAAAWYWFIPPYDSFAITGAGLVAIAFFVLVMAVDLVIIHVMNRAMDQLRREKDYSDRLAEHQKTMFQELQHRAANNLAFVSGLLSIHQLRLQDPVAKATLEDARLRLETMSKVHRRLYDPSNVDRPLSEYLDELCRDVLESAGVRNVLVSVDAPDAKFEIETLLNLSLIIVECVTNAIKHAFRVKGGGVIRVALKPEAEGTYILSVADDGVGFPESFSPERSERLGFRIVQGFAHSLKGEIGYHTDRGGVVTMRFRA